MTYPVIDPVAFQIGPVPIRWYALAYLAGILLGWVYARYVARLYGGRPNSGDIDTLALWTMFGIILGGRLGYIFFYEPAQYLADPLSALVLWHGGMSFHGGFLGVALAMLLFARRYKLPPLKIADIVAPVVPIGLFFGRMANFINGELWGRVSDVPWAMVFPGAGPLPRHPSQLYEAALEGILLLVILAVLVHAPKIRNRPGMISGVFLLGYGVSRVSVEFFREPDASLGFFFGGATMGQMLSLPMIVAGLTLILWAAYRDSKGRASATSDGKAGG